MDGLEYQAPSGQGFSFSNGFGGGYSNGYGGSYVPPAIDKAIGGGLDTISACGASNVTTLIMLILVSILCGYLMIRNSKVVDKTLDMIPQAIATIQTTVKNFEDKVDVLIKVFKKD